MNLKPAIMVMELSRQNNGLPSTLCLGSERLRRTGKNLQAMQHSSLCGFLQGCEGFHGFNGFNDVNANEILIIAGHSRPRKANEEEESYASHFRIRSHHRGVGRQNSDMRPMEAQDQTERRKVRRNHAVRAVEQPLPESNTTTRVHRLIRRVSFVAACQRSPSPSIASRSDRSKLRELHPAAKSFCASLCFSWPCLQSTPSREECLPQKTRKSTRTENVDERLSITCTALTTSEHPRCPISRRLEALKRSVQSAPIC